MLATILKWIVILLAVLNSGYMVFDGTRALITGDYIRPKSGEYAGQLGPWTKAVEKVGLDPMSTLMKSVFVIWGLAGLIIAICYALGVSWAWNGMMVFNICSLWYLFMGTGSSILQIILLLVIHFIS